MKRCASCGHAGLVDDYASSSVRVGQKIFSALLPARTCPACNEAYIAHETLARFEMTVAKALVERAARDGSSFAFMRKALGLRSVELAELLAVAPETISRWEHDKIPVEHCAMALLGALVLEKVAGGSSTSDRLRALAKNTAQDPSPVDLGRLP